MCINKGTVASLFMNPHIPTAFYGAGTGLKINLSNAIDAHTEVPIKANMDIVIAKMALVVVWLDSYTNQVETISNDPDNRTTRQEAATNIALSGLNPQKITKSSKGTPAIPTFTVTDAGAGTAKVLVTNDVEFNPSTVVMICVEIPSDSEKVIAPASVELKDGQLKVTCTVAVDMITTTITGKGRKGQFDELKKNISYNVYLYSKNGNTLMSKLSAPVRVNM